MSQMIEKNPILCDTMEMRMRYLELLKAHAQKENWPESRMAAAALQVYENALTAEPSETEPNPLEFYKGFFRMDCQFLREMARQDGESRDAVVNPEIKGQLGTSQEKTYCRALQKKLSVQKKNTLYADDHSKHECRKVHLYQCTDRKTNLPVSDDGMYQQNPCHREQGVRGWSVV